MLDSGLHKYSGHSNNHRIIHHISFTKSSSVASSTTHDRLKGKVGMDR